MSGPQPERDGPMAGHVRSGRKYLPGLAATGLLAIQDWIRDDLPDLIWPALVLAEHGSDFAGRFIAWQAAVLTELGETMEPVAIADGLDGRLTSLEQLVANSPDARQVIREVALAEGLLSDATMSALASYPRIPASWLHGQSHVPPEQDDIALLSRAVREAISDGHREALIKCLSIWSAVQAGTFKTDQKMVELLQPYPDELESRSMADSAIRAAWGASRGAQLHTDGARFGAAIQWAKVFWGCNSISTRCLRKKDVEPSVVGPNTDPVIADGDDESDGARLRQVAMDIVSSYVEALEIAPAHLYDPEQQEVHAGLIVRASRDVINALGFPDLWCLEHGAHVGRMLVEVRILVQWMNTQGPSIYGRYQAFGAGKAKLYSRILEEIPDQARTADFTDALAEVAQLSHNHDIIDHRVVDTADSFAGKSIREMASECGLLDLYRHNYYMASGVAHSEWWSVETHAMERCLNVLHRGHLIPSLSLNAGANLALARAWVDQLYALIRISLEILETEADAVSTAFGWLEDGDTAEPPD